MKKALICCTVRTKELYDRFKNGIAKKCHVVEHELEQKQIWYYLKYTRIVLLEITQSA